VNTSSARVANIIALAALVTVVSASPALAQSTGANLGSFIQNIVDLLTNTIIRGLAILAVMVTGIMWLFGRLDLHRAGTVVVAIIVVFGAPTIVDLVTNGAGS
jgi:type IV secretory pathway VirB2 component (pilin)